MKNVAKKVIIYSMVGLMQVGMFASAAEAAAPRHGDAPRNEQYHDQRYEPRDDHQQRDSRKEKERRLHEENKRHEQEMKRRPFESKKNWHQRQRYENERHERAIHELMEMRHR